MTRDEILNMEAGREMDCAVDEFIFGNEWTHIAPGVPWDDIPTYSTDIAAAWQVVEKLERDYPHSIIRVSNGDSDSCDCDILGYGKLGVAHISIDGGLENAPLAICRAALLAIQEGGE